MCTLCACKSVCVCVRPCVCDLCDVCMRERESREKERDRQTETERRLLSIIIIVIEMKQRAGHAVVHLYPCIAEGLQVDFDAEDLTARSRPRSAAELSRQVCMIAVKTGVYDSCQGRCVW